MWNMQELGYRLSWRWQDTIGLQHPEGKNFALGITYAWWNAVDEWNHLAGRWGVRHQWQRKNQDPENQHEAQHETQRWPEHVSVRVVLQSSLVLVLCCHTYLLHTSHGSRCLSVCLIPSHGHSYACMKWAFSLTSLTSSSSPSSSHSSLSSSSSFYPSTSPRLSSKPCALRQGDEVHWRILVQHRLWAQGLLPHRDVRRLPRFCGKHRDTTSTTVVAGARSKCGTIASFLLCTRKFDVQSISRSDMYGETLRVVSKPEQVESKHIFHIETIFPSDINRFLVAGEL